MLQITLSGPQSSRKKAIDTLKDVGFQVVLDEVGDPLAHSFGMEPNHETEIVGGVPVALSSSVPTGFVTVTGDSVDRAVEFVEPLRWRLRAHSEVN